MSTLERATIAWLRRGNPATALQSMSEDELQQLAELSDDQGGPVTGFLRKYEAFYRSYCEARKTTDQVNEE